MNDDMFESITQLVKYNPDNKGKISQFLKTLKNPISHITFETPTCKVDLDDTVLVNILTKFQTKMGCKYNIWRRKEEKYIDLYECYNKRTTRNYQYDLNGECIGYSIYNGDASRVFIWSPSVVKLRLLGENGIEYMEKTYDNETRKLIVLTKIDRSGTCPYVVKRVEVSTIVKFTIKLHEYMPIDHDDFRDIGSAFKMFADDTGLDDISPEKILYDNWKL